ncbi:hypothetical protein EDD17DRAFT_1678209 [Pisolithus thermaeus]|nr:hypothetical protein EDD17DRAFT_1678209 [Pisolithus thermaeus]
MLSWVSVEGPIFTFFMLTICQHVTCELVRHATLVSAYFHAPCLNNSFDRIPTLKWTLAFQCHPSPKMSPC